MSLAVVKILLAITGIGMPIMVIIPKPPTIHYAFAAAIPIILFVLYLLTKCAVINETLNEIDRRRGYASPKGTSEARRSRRA